MTRAVGLERLLGRMGYWVACPAVDGRQVWPDGADWMVKAAPPPGRFSALTWPPWASTKPFTIARPRPRAPGRGRRGRGRTCRRSGEARPAAGRGRCPPRSIRSVSASTAALTWTAVPGGVCTAAFNKQIRERPAASGRSLARTSGRPGRQLNGYLVLRQVFLDVLERHLDQVRHVAPIELRL